jgi:hypothetical protein
LALATLALVALYALVRLVLYFMLPSNDIRRDGRFWFLESLELFVFYALIPALLLAFIGAIVVDIRRRRQ